MSVTTVTTAVVAKIIASATTLVWQELGGNVGGPFGKISSCSLADCAATANPLLSAGRMAGTFTFDPSSGRYYWQIDNAVSFSVLSPWSAATYTPTLVLPENLQISGGYLYGGGFASGSAYQLARAPADGSASPTVLASDVVAGSHQIVGTNLFVTARSGSQYYLARLSLPGDASSGLPPQLPGSPLLTSAVVPYADATGIYWLDGTNLNTCSLAGCSGPPKVIAPAPGALQPLIGDSHGFYWRELSGATTRVMTLAR